MELKLPLNPDLLAKIQQFINRVQAMPKNTQDSTSIVKVEKVKDNK